MRGSCVIRHFDNLFFMPRDVKVISRGLDAKLKDISFKVIERLFNGEFVNNVICHIRNSALELYGYDGDPCSINDIDSGIIDRVWNMINSMNEVNEIIKLQNEVVSVDRITMKSYVNDDNVLRGRAILYYILKSPEKTRYMTFYIDEIGGMDRFYSREISKTKYYKVCKESE